MEIQISVRAFVEFLMRSGDIDNRRSVGSEDAMAEGARIHRMIQRRMGGEYHSEVSLSHTVQLADYAIVIEGRADGIIDRQNGDMVVVDEIKTTYRELKRIKRRNRFILPRRNAMPIFMHCKMNCRRLVSA